MQQFGDVTDLQTTPHGRPAWLVGGYGAAIGLLGGLIGLGGAEFRLPVLAGPLGYSAREAVPLNLAISMATLLAALAIRIGTLSLASVASLSTALLGLIAGAVLSAFFGAGLASRLSKTQLERVIVILLVLIGCALIVEGFLPQQASGLVPAEPNWQVAIGLLFGLAIGLVSSLLGVAGGELIIPTLVFAFGADIKTAGTASLLVSLPTVAVGLVRYGSRGAFAQRRPLIDTVAPMSIGSVIGAVVGGLAVGIVPAAVLKVTLGIVLNVSALKMFHGRHTRPSGQPAVSQPVGRAGDVVLATTTSVQDSGLLGELVPLFERRTGYRVRVVAVGTGAALALGARGEADVVLAHAPQVEERWMAQGYGVLRLSVMSNDFVIAGPPEDPARVKDAPRALDAVRCIAAAAAPWISHGDYSGTHLLEPSLWRAAEVDPAGQGWLHRELGRYGADARFGCRAPGLYVGRSRHLGSRTCPPRITDPSGGRPATAQHLPRYGGGRRSIPHGASK